MENGYSSPRADKFPAGLRVLVVDDDPTWLKILEKMLKKCSYEVTTCCLARDALNLLRERKYGFDLVISDVNMPDMDGFKLLEHVGLEMDLPVIMMSVDGETSRVMKGVQHGACDYLLKPIRMKELSNIWQHVLRKKIHEAKDTDYYECFGNFQLIKNKSEDFHDGILTNGASLGTLKKRKEADNIKHDDQETVDPSSKKARVVWTVDLHQKFVDAVNQIGFDKVGPKKILDTMKVPGLTRENVASHLQKFRLYLGRLEKENELNASLRGTKLLEFPAGDPPGSFGFQNSFGMGQNNVVNDNFGHTRNRIRVDDMGQKVHEGDLKGMVSFLQARTIKNPLTSDLPDHQKSIITPQIEPNHSIKSLAHSFEYQSLESTRPAQQWNEVPMMQSKQPLKQIPKHEPKPYSLLEANCKTRLFSGPVPEHHFQVNFQHPSPSVDIQMPPSENGDRTEFLVRRAINSIALTADGQIINPEAFKAISATTSSAMRNQIADQHCIDNWTPVQQKIIAGGSTLMPSLEENIQFLLQEYGRGENIGYQNCYYNPELIDELQTDCYGELGIHWDKLHGSIESNFVDQSLFIA